MHRTADAAHPFKYYDVLAILIVVLTLVSNIVSFKMIDIGPFTVRMGVFVSAAAYILADILVDVYGFARMRRVIWMTLVSMAVMMFLFKCAVVLPGALDWKNSDMFNTVFDRDLRTVLTTLFALFCGHMSNALIMAKMKLMTNGDHFWMRSVTSSFIGHGLNAILFYTFGKIGILDPQEIIPAIVSSWFLRLAYELIFLPFSTSIVSMLKKIEGVDVFDKGTNLNPFRFSLFKN